MKFLLFTSLALLLAGPLQAREYLSGSLIDPGGKTIAISRISARGTLTGVVAGQEVVLGFSELKKIEYLGDRVYRATTLKGVDLLVEKAELRTPGQQKRLVYWASVPGTPQERQFVLGNQSFHTLFLTGKPGRVKVNPRTGQLYPHDYMFDPFTAEPLKWRDPGY